METVGMIKFQIKILNHQKGELLKKMEKISRTITDGISQVTISDLQLNSYTQDFNRILNEYTFIQGQISTYQTCLYQLEGEKGSAE